MILFYNYYFRFDSKQVFECFFLSFCSVAKLCLFPSGTMCTICGWGQKTNKAISLLINNIALFNLLKDV